MMFPKKRFLHLVIVGSVISLMSSVPVLADAEVEEFVKDEIVKNIEVTAEKYDDEKVRKCFSGTFYKVEIKTPQPGGGSVTVGGLYLKDEEGVRSVPKPMTTAEMPQLLAIANPNFKLRTAEDGKTIQGALTTLYPSAVDDDVEQRVLQNGTTWSLIMDDFFDDFSGFVIETDEQGKITQISRNL